MYTPHKKENEVCERWYQPFKHKSSSFIFYVLNDMYPSITSNITCSHFNDSLICVFDSHSFLYYIPYFSKKASVRNRSDRITLYTFSQSMDLFIFSEIHAASPDVTIRSSKCNIDINEQNRSFSAAPDPFCTKNKNCFLKMMQNSIP